MLGAFAALILLAILFHLLVEFIDERIGYPWGGVFALTLYAILLAAAISTITASASLAGTVHSAEPAGTSPDQAP